MTHLLIRKERRRRLADLDHLLYELESLNLADRDEVPDGLATQLELQGVGAARKKVPSELIEDVFELQRPFLRPNPLAARPNLAPSVRRPLAAGWVSF
jgi:hypothetical protein